MCSSSLRHACLLACMPAFMCGRYASSQGMLFFETSAKEDINVGMMFRSTAREVLKRIEEGKITVGDAKCGVKMEDYAPAASRSTDTPAPRRKRGCC